MKKKIYLIFIDVILLAILIGINTTISLGTGRLVDIPVPPNSSGYTDFSPEEGDEREKQYDEQVKNKNMASDLIGKSSNNYLKKLEIEGYQLDPKFDKKTNDYVLDFKNKKDVSKIKIIAETEEPYKTKIEGDGEINITEGQDIININVIAENGNLNVYTINLKNRYVDETENKSENNVLNKEVTENNSEKADDKKQINNTIMICIPIAICITIMLIVSNYKKK